MNWDDIYYPTVICLDCGHPMECHTPTWCFHPDQGDDLPCACANTHEDIALKLMAERDRKLDAVRKLAEEFEGSAVWTESNFMPGPNSTGYVSAMREGGRSCTRRARRAREGGRAMRLSARRWR